MLIAGGPRYKWKGHNVRSLNDGVSFVRRDSFVVVPIILDPERICKISFIAKNTGGDGRVEVELIDCGLKKNTIIASTEFKKYEVEFIDHGLKHTRVKVGKFGTQGNVIVKEIHCEKMPTFDEIQTAQKEKLLERQQQIGELEAKKSKEHREEDLKTLLAGRSSNIIGGNGYNWRGKGLKSAVVDGTSCILLYEEISTIMAPISVSPTTNYKISVLAWGFTTLFFQFFGSKEINSQIFSTKLYSNETKEYTVLLDTPEFRSNFPIYLKIWHKENKESGIKTIRYEKGDSVAKDRPKKLKPKIIEAPNQVFEEMSDMRFKPYALRKNADEQLVRVLITQASDVPLVSIITPTRDGLELLKKCWTALEKNTSYPNWEWIVGDSNSQDGTADWFKSLADPRVKFVQRNTTEGSFSSINNELVQHANGEYLLFLNDDTEPQPMWLYEMMSKIVRDPSIGVVGAQLLYENGQVQHAGICFIPQGPANIGFHVLENFPKNFKEYDRFLQAVTGACLLIRTEDFKAVEGFDPVYFFCYEDVDLCLKVRSKLKKQVLYASRAIVKHHESITQKKHRTAGEKQQNGIKIFKERWNKAEIDYSKFQQNVNYGIKKVDVSVITCVNNYPQYLNYVVGSLFKNSGSKNYELIPVLNYSNKYSASQALNIGMQQARADICVLCHQDVIFYENWLNLLFDRIGEIEYRNPRWGILGTAGISLKDDTFGVVYSIKGKVQWHQTKRETFGEVQTVDEHCMIVKKSSGLKFDEGLGGFHAYGGDICLQSLAKNLKNYGILNPLVHDSNSGSLVSGRSDFMRHMNFIAKKWKNLFPLIRTTTSIIRDGKIQTFIKFKE